SLPFKGRPGLMFPLLLLSVLGHPLPSWERERERGNMLFEKRLISLQSAGRAQRDAWLACKRPLTLALSQEGRGWLKPPSFAPGCSFSLPWWERARVRGNMLFEKCLISLQSPWRARRDAWLACKRPLTLTLSHQGRKGENR